MFTQPYGSWSTRPRTKQRSWGSAVSQPSMRGGSWSTRPRTKQRSRGSAVSQPSMRGGSWSTRPRTKLRLWGPWSPMVSLRGRRGSRWARRRSSQREQPRRLSARRSRSSRSRVALGGVGSATGARRLGAGWGLLGTCLPLIAGCRVGGWFRVWGGFRCRRRSSCIGVVAARRRRGNSAAKADGPAGHLVQYRWSQR